MKRPALSIVIPAFNEAIRLPMTLAKLGAFVAGRPEVIEIIVVADGSTDDTVRIAETAAKESSTPILVRANSANHGKGYCVAQGVQMANGSRLLMTDADLSTPLTEVDRLAPSLNRGYAVAVGSRILRGKGILVERSSRRAVVGKLFALLTSRLVATGIHDTQCGFKLFETESARNIFARLTVNRFAFDVEVLVIAAAQGYRVAEIPVSWREDPRSNVHLLRDSCDMFQDLLRIRRQLRTGIYSAARDSEKRP
jgi:dolichyl-phosphate beta-glucosyltransferase